MSPREALVRALTDPVQVCAPEDAQRLVEDFERAIRGEQSRQCAEAARVANRRRIRKW